MKAKVELDQNIKLLFLKMIIIEERIFTITYDKSLKSFFLDEPNYPIFFEDTSIHFQTLSCKINIPISQQRLFLSENQSDIVELDIIDIHSYEPKEIYFDSQQLKKDYYQIVKILKEKLNKSDELDKKELLWLMALGNLDYVLYENQRKMHYLMNLFKQPYEESNLENLDGMMGENNVIAKPIQLSLAQFISLLGCFCKVSGDYLPKRLRHIKRNQKEYRVIYICQDNIKKFSEKIKSHNQIDSFIQEHKQIYGNLYLNGLFEQLERMVFAHELGHLAFEPINMNNPNYQINKYAFNDEEKDFFRERIEKQANYFASFMLNDFDEFLPPLIEFKCKFQSPAYQHPFLIIPYNKEYKIELNKYQELLKMTIDRYREVGEENLKYEANLSVNLFVEFIKQSSVVIDNYHEYVDSLFKDS